MKEPPRYVPRAPADGINVTPRHPLREAALLVAGTALAGAAFVVLAALVVEFGARLLPPSWEARAFGLLWSYTEDPSEAPDPTMRQALQELTDRLAGHWPDNPYAFRVDLMEAEDPNAFAVPGGRLFVTRGLLESVQTENELAFVLGHELGHFHNRDSIRRLGRGLLVGVVWSLLVGDVGISLPSLAVQLAERGFDRSQESAADRFGLDLLQREYRHVAEFDAFFRHLAGREQAARPWTRYLSTHPFSEERVRDLRREVSRRGWTEQGPVTPLPVALRPVGG